MTIQKMRASSSRATVCGLALLIGASGSATAQDLTVLGEVPADVLTERVSYDDLDLASAAGADSLQSRVRGAVRRVCAPHDERHSFSDYGACRSFAFDGAVPQMELAIARAEQIALTGTSTIAPVAILIAAPSR